MSAGELLQARQPSDERRSRTDVGVGKTKAEEEKSESRKRKTEEWHDKDSRSIPRGSSPRKYEEYTPTVATAEQILMEINDQNTLKSPARMKAGAYRRNRDKFCQYHNDHGHHMSDCYDLKMAIEALIQKGQLKEYVRGKAEDPQNEQQLEEKGSPPPREIRTIMGGMAGGESGRKRKAQVREAKNVLSVRGTHFTTNTSLTISFTEEEARKIHQPHNDALVISLSIAHIKIRRILVDGGSSADILSLHTYKTMKWKVENLKPSVTPLVGFGGGTIIPEGSIELPVTLGEGDRFVTVMVTFFVVRESSTYNAILGRPTIHNLKAITSTYHQVMKFPTLAGVGIVYGEQAAARECYHTTLKGI